MTKEEVKVLSIQLQDKEVDVWNCIIAKLEKMTNEVGFNKTFTSAEIELIKELNTKEDE